MNIESLKADPSMRVKEIVVTPDLSVEVKIDKESIGSGWISEEEAIQIDLESIKKEIEQEPVMKIEKMLPGIIIDEIDP